MSYINYENIKKPTKKYDCKLTLLKSDLDTSLYNPLIEVIGKLNLIGNYIKNNEDNWSSEGLSGGGDTLEFPLSAINGLQTSSTNKILYYNNDGDWEYKDYKELKFPLSELYNLTSDDLDGDKWVLVYDLESSNDRGWKFLPYNTGTGSGLTPGKVAYDLNTVNNPNTNVKQILVWDNDGNGWKWQIENYTSSSSGGLTWNDLINQGSEKIHSSHLPSSWWGRTISNNIVEGNLSGNIQYIKFDSGGHTVYLGLDSEGNLRVSKSENGNDGSSGANFYATGGVSALGNSSSSGGGGTPGETSLNSLLNNINDLGTSYQNPSTGFTIVYNGSNWVDRKLNLSELGDINISNLSNNQVLTYDSQSGKWINSSTLSVVSKLGNLSDVDDTVSSIKAENVIQLSGSTYSYPFTLLVGRTSETSSNIYNSEVEWELYVFLFETDSSAAHYIDGESLTSNMGIVTRLNFGLAGSPMNKYRFPTYITGVNEQNSDTTRYHITGAKHIKGKTINNNNQTWNLDYDETFCSQNVYIQDGELYSGGNFKVLTTNNLNGTGFSGKNYAISSNNGKLYVNVPWTDNDTTYSAGNGLTGTSTFSVLRDGDNNSGLYVSNSGVKVLLNNSNPGLSLTGGLAVRAAGGLTVDNEGVKINPNTNKRKLWGNNDTLLNDIGIENSLADLKFVNRIAMGDELYMRPNSNTKEYAAITLNTSSLLIGYGTAQNSPANDSYHEENRSALENRLPTIIYGNGINFKSKGDGTDVLSLSNAGLTYLPIATAPTTGLRIGNAILYWEEDKQALALAKYNESQPDSPSAANFYATGGVSALGFSNGQSSIDAMTFGNLTVNNQLKMGEDVTLLNNNNWLLINGVEGVGIDNELQISGNITCSGVTLDDNVTLLYEDPELILRIGNTNYKITKTIIQG